MAVKKIQLNKGQLLPTNYGTVEVLYHNTSRDVGVKFVDTGYVVTGLQVGNVVRGNVKDMRVPTVAGKGYLNTSEHVTKEPSYSYWRSMLERAYSDKYHELRPTYSDVEVCEPWLDYTIFRQWFNENYVEGYSLDKDIVGNGKLYSPETCCLVPPFVNSLVTDNANNRGDCPIGVSKRRVRGKKEYNGLYTVATSGVYLGRYDCPDKAYEVYKEFREFLFLNVAEVYLERGLITDRVYQALATRKII